MVIDPMVLRPARQLQRQILDNLVGRSLAADASCMRRLGSHTYSANIDCSVLSAVLSTL